MPGLKGPKGARAAIEKPANGKETTKKLIKHYLIDYKWQLLIMLIFAVGSTVFTIVGPKILGNATTEIFNGIVGKISGGTGIDFSKVLGILLTLLGLYAISTFFGYIQGFTMTSVAQKLTYRLRNDVAVKINKLPMSFFDKKTQGEILSIVTNDIDMLSQNLNQSITQIITSVCTIIGILIMMLTISVTMTLVSLIIVPLSFLIIRIVVKKSQKYFKKQQDYLAYVNGLVEEDYSGHDVIRVFNRENKTIEEFDRFNKELYKSAWKSQFLSGLMFPIMNFFGNVGYVGVAILGGYLASQGIITVGNIQSFIQYNKQFVQPINQISQISATLQSMLAAAERIFGFLEEDDEARDAENFISTDGLVGNVEFNHVHFGYTDDKIIINDFNAKVKDGQKIAIVGPTGAGKTTMVKLLMRFYDVNSGAIMIDGHNVKDFKRGELRRMFGMVLQDTWLFNGTIKENLMYGKLDASDEEVKNACEMAYVDHFVNTLEDGYDTVLDEETSNISQGQKQLLTIARAFLKDPKILILDEATSSVDTRTEVLIQKGMEKLMEGRTSFVIAHRLSTIRDANTIIVMKDGDIVEIGNHDELLEKGGFYASLYQSQFEGSEI